MVEENNTYSQLYVIPSDNTKVFVLIPIKTRLTLNLILALLRRELDKLSKASKSRIYDTKKADFFKKMQDNYNLNSFGYGILGIPIIFDYTTDNGLQYILSNFEYAKNNAINFIDLVAGIGIGSAASKGVNKSILTYNKLTKGKFKTPSKKGSLGAMDLYIKDGTIGSGAEAVVIDNTPFTVGKITAIPEEEMLIRNTVPHTVKSKYIGFVKDNGIKLPTYIQRKVKILNENTFPKYIQRLDNSMKKAGFMKVRDPNVLYRAYTNGKIVIDDVAPDNVGLDWLRRPKMIDFNVQTIPEWLEQGFILKDGGSLISKHLMRNVNNIKK